MDCELCHDDVDVLRLRDDRWLCDSCTAGWDYEASLTPEERRADEQAVARYVDENAHSS